MIYTDHSENSPRFADDSLNVYFWLWYQMVN